MNLRRKGKEKTYVFDFSGGSRSEPIRLRSNSFGSIILEEENHKILFIPEGFDRIG